MCVCVYLCKHCKLALNKQCFNECECLCDTLFVYVEIHTKLWTGWIQKKKKEMKYLKQIARHNKLKEETV